MSTTGLVCSPFPVSDSFASGAENPVVVPSGAFAMSIRHDRAGCCSVALCGELDLALAPVVASELRRLEKSHPKLILVDLDALEFLDLTGMRVLVAAHQRASEEGRSFIAAGASGAVRRLLEITGVERILNLLHPPVGAVICDRHVPRAEGRS